MFKSLRPGAIVALALYALLLKSIFLAHPAVAGTAEMTELSRSLFEVLHQFGNSTHLIMTLLGIASTIIIAILLNNLCDFFAFFPDRNLFIAQASILVTSVYFFLNYFSPVSITLLFLLIAVSETFALYTKEVAGASIFNIGLYISVAMLFYAPALIFFPIALLSIWAVRFFSIRETALYLLGVVTPIYLGGVIWFLFSDINQFALHQIQIFEVSWGGAHDWYTFEESWAKGAILLLIALMAGGWYFSQYTRRAIDQRRFADVLIWYFLGGISLFIWRGASEPESLLVCLLPISIFAGVFFHDKRKWWLAEALHGAALFVILFLNYYHLLEGSPI